MPEEAIGELLSTKVAPPAATEEDCKDFYAKNPQAFVRGEQAEASHILFTPENGVPASLLRAKAEGILSELKLSRTSLKHWPSNTRLARRASRAARWANLVAARWCRNLMLRCSAWAKTSCCRNWWKPSLACTSSARAKKTTGEAVSYDEVKDRLAEFLTETASRRAMHEYLQSLVQKKPISRAISSKLAA